MSDARKIYEKYFLGNDEAIIGLRKAVYAYHEHALPLSHFFNSNNRTARCVQCERSREQVRWDELPAHCAGPYSSMLARGKEKAESILMDEEKNYSRLIDSAKDMVPRFIAKMGINGKTLAILHHTHGYEPEVVAGIVDVDRQSMIDYESEMEIERSRSRADRKSKVKI